MCLYQIKVHETCMGKNENKQTKMLILRKLIFSEDIPAKVIFKCMLHVIENFSCFRYFTYILLGYLPQASWHKVHSSNIFITCLSPIYPLPFFPSKGKQQTKIAETKGLYKGYSQPIGLKVNTFSEALKGYSQIQAFYGINEHMCT